MSETPRITQSEADQFINSHLAFHGIQLTKKQKQQLLAHLDTFRQSNQALENELVRKIQEIRGD